MDKINIAEILESSKVNGPGTRFVIWMQGCLNHCKNCSNSDFIPQEVNRLYTVSELFSVIEENRDKIEGVTLSGGEPMLQADILYKLGLKIKSIGLTLLCYTGYTLEYIEQHGSAAQKQLLTILDILIDGEYQDSKKSNLLWRGSSNQRVYFLTPRYREYAKDLDSVGREIEIIIRDGEIISTGFPK